MNYVTSITEKHEFMNIGYKKEFMTFYINKSLNYLNMEEYLY